MTTSAASTAREHAAGDALREGAAGKIAVVAVHGVGDQLPSATARAIARLLQRCHGADPEIDYSPFSEEALELPVDEWTAYEDSRIRSTPSGRAFGADVWYVRSDFVKQGDIRADETADTAFTRRALETARIADDQPERTHYCTVRVSGTRSSAANETVVDVYELFWADLAKKTGGIAQILGRFYQLLFHLSFLGVKTVEWAWAAERDERIKQRLRTVLATQTIVDALLGGVTPVLNVVLAGMILPVLVLRLPESYRALALALLVGVGSAGIIYAWARSYVGRADVTGRLALPRAVILLLPTLLGVVVALTMYFAVVDSGRPSVDALSGLYALAQLAALALVVWLTSKLADRRAPSPRAGAHGDRDGQRQPATRSWFDSVPRATLAPALAIVAWLWWAAWHYQTAADGELSSQLLLTVAHAAEGFLAIINVAWIVLMAAACAMCAAGWWCLRAVQRDNLATRRAIWTGKMGFLVSASLFSLVTLIAWAALVKFIKPAIPAGLTYTEWLPLFGGCVDDPALLCKLALLDDSVGGAGYNLFLLVLLLSAAALVIVFLPSFLMEGAPVRDRDPARSASLGRWLDSGLVSLRVWGYVLLAALVVVVPVLGVVGAFYPTLFGMGYDRHGFWSSSLVAYAGGALVAPLALMVSLRRNLFGGFQRAVNIALDVDNWLGERPAESNPRGHILLRYLALIKHIEAQGYSRVVFVTHSQGTVITADLLRFLQTGSTRVLQSFAARAKRLLTAGSPLRQLYGLRFPHWYGWCGSADQDGGSSQRRGDRVGGRDPSAAGLGVAHWTNIYRSGDYVGRYLWWRDHDDNDPWTPLSTTSHNALSDDVCLERGAHTHYFDGSTGDVGKMIDRLLA